MGHDKSPKDSSSNCISWPMNHEIDLELQPAFKEKWNQRVNIAHDTFTSVTFADMFRTVR